MLACSFYNLYKTKIKNNEYREMTAYLFNNHWTYEDEGSLVFICVKCVTDVVMWLYTYVYTYILYCTLVYLPVFHDPLVHRRGLRLHVFLHQNYFLYA